jgi:hypothetical protein
VKLIVEQRRALPSRFRTKQVLMLLGMTLMPAVLVLLVGSELIRQHRALVQRADGDSLLRQRIASDTARNARSGRRGARRVARALASVDLSARLAPSAASWSR